MNETIPFQLLGAPLVMVSVAVCGSKTPLACQTMCLLFNVSKRREEQNMKDDKEKRRQRRKSERGSTEKLHLGGGRRAHDFKGSQAVPRRPCGKGKARRSEEGKALGKAGN
jgi:hypothetical protein